MSKNASVVRRPVRPGRGLGFTLIELLLVLVILGVLAALVVPRFVKRGEQARNTAAAADLSLIGTQLNAFEVDCGRYPTTEDGLQALLEPRGAIRGWKGPYLERMPKDPWGNPYIYRCPGQHNANGFDLYSWGPDAQEGGGDDIDNWSDR